jgi:hypothetical protein
MSTSMKLDEGEVSSSLDVTSLGTLLHLLVEVLGKLQAVKRSLDKLLLARPLKSLCPSLVSEPVADEIGISLWNC